MADTVPLAPLPDDIFHLLDLDAASLLREHLSRQDAMKIALSYSPFGRRHFAGNKRQVRLFRKLKLIDKAKGQEKFPLDLCEFEFTDHGVHIAERLNAAHQAKLTHFMALGDHMDSERPEDQ